MTGPTVEEIAELLDELRRLTELGPAADPAEREAAIKAKAELLTRIEEETR